MASRPKATWQLDNGQCPKYSPDKGRLWCADASSETRDLVCGRRPKN
ncbi:hypothetical protein BCL76_10746 [Streptomyces sp. CG 926]|nr:hypothetical protein [Streptomyces sp. CG 926]PWK68588.1 hypothetical protein BCL76_10746 [Streptomyces sp. CG 926]